MLALDSGRRSGGRLGKTKRQGRVGIGAGPGRGAGSDAKRQCHGDQELDKCFHTGASARRAPTLPPSQSRVDLSRLGGDQVDPPR
jgi:hypothetical protein